MHSAQKISGAILTQTGPMQHEQHDNASALSGREKQLRLQTVLSRTILGSTARAAGSLQNVIHLEKKKQQTTTHTQSVSENDFSIRDH